MFQTRRKRFEGQSLNMMIPNLLTLMSLCAGLSAMRFALMARWEWAVAAIILAGFLDNIDGRMARLLGGGSKFGDDKRRFPVPPRAGQAGWKAGRLIR